MKTIINFHLRFNFKLKKSTPILPSIAGIHNSTPENELLRQAQEGLEIRLENFILKKAQLNIQDQIKKNLF